jgi:hypothetical protein
MYFHCHSPIFLPVKCQNWVMTFNMETGGEISKWTLCSSRIPSPQHRMWLPGIGQPRARLQLPAPEVVGSRIQSTLVCLLLPRRRHSKQEALTPGPGGARAFRRWVPYAGGVLRQCQGIRHGTHRTRAHTRLVHLLGSLPFLIKPPVFSPGRPTLMDN